jgi:hypothetical protein
VTLNDIGLYVNLTALDNICVYAKLYLIYPSQNTKLFIINNKGTIQCLKMAVVWVVTPCSVVEVYGSFRGACCLHRQGDGTRRNVFV